MFKLSIGKKDAINYGYYNKNNNNKRCGIDVYMKNLSLDERLTFLETMKNENSYCDRTKTFNPLAYYYSYLKMDCLVLKEGMKVFAENVSEATRVCDEKTSKVIFEGINIYQHLTICSAADYYFSANGGFDGVYEVSHNLRDFCQQAVLGGRVAVNEKYKKVLIEEEIADYDGVSLYPSAIHRLCKERGLAKGKASRLLSSDNWKSKFHAIIKIRITKVNKTQQLPFISYKDSEGSLIYTNDPPPKEVVVDSITLEDWIKFHQIEYEVIDGVYWEGGGNRKMEGLVVNLFNTRLKYKKSNPQLADIIKLMLNGAYGKTLIKKSTTSTVFKKQKTFKKVDGEWKEQKSKTMVNYIYNNHNTILQARAWSHTIDPKNSLTSNTKLEPQGVWEITQASVDNSYNRVHIGASILSMSKRIMNEVFDIANSNNLPIYYTDTDSMHIQAVDVQRLENAYRVTYNKELTGKNLGQFHTDFNMKGACGDIVAVKSIFLGKKSYIDKIKSVDADGDTIYDHHIRLKGITKEGIDHCVKTHFDGDPLTMFEHLAKGNEQVMILNPFDEEQNKQKATFVFKGGKVFIEKCGNFKRTLKF